MRLETLISGLKISGLQWIYDENRGEEIDSYMRLNRRMVPEKHVLYVGRYDDLPDCMPAGIFNFAIVMEAEMRLPADLTKLKGSNVLICVEPCAAETIEQALCHFFGQKNQYTRYSFTLLEAVNNGASLEELADLVYQMTGNIAFAVNTEYCVIAMSHYKGSIPSRPDLQEQQATGYLLQDNIENLKQDKIYDRIRIAKEPYLWSHAGEPEWLHDLIYLHEIEAGSVSFMQLDHPFTVHDRLFIRTFATAAGRVLERSFEAQQNKGYLYSSLLSDLIRNDQMDKVLVNFRMRQMNWTVTRYLYLMTVYDNHTSSFQSRSQFICEHIQSYFSNCRWTIYDGRLYFLIALPDPDPAMIRENTPFLSYLRNNMLTASVSDCYHDILHTGTAARQCDKTALFGRRRMPGQSLYLFADYYMDFVASGLSERNDPLEYCSREVLRIAEYDQKKGTECLRTVKSYLRHAAILKEVADELHIHKNTLFYRLGKIRELFHLDLQNGDECFQIRLSIALLEYNDIVQG